MPEASHTLMVQAPLGVVWEFVREMGKWARLVPGFQHFVPIDERQSRWTVKGNLGVVSRTVEFCVDITEWVECSQVAFRLRALNENATGRGALHAAKDTDSSTTLKFQLSLEAGGTMGPMVNALMGPVLPRLVIEFARAIGEEIERTYRESGVDVATPPQSSRSSTRRETS